MPKYTVSKAVQALAALVVAFAAGCASTSGQQTAANVEPAPPSAAPAAPFVPAYARQEAPQPVAAPVQVREDAPVRYVVQKGDTLWGIAGKFLVDPWQWPEVWVVNDQVRNPHRIYPGDVLTLVWRNGRPQVEVSASDRLSPRVRESDISAAIPTIPIDAIRDFLRSPRLVTADEIRRAPYVLDFVDLHIIGANGQGAFVKKVPAGGKHFEVVRIGQDYRDPDTGDVLGYEAIPTALAEVVEPGEPATVMLSRSYRETHAGDYLIPPLDDSFNTDFYPHVPAQPFSGRIISVFDGISQIGQYQVVVLNRGGRHGLEAGHVLDILQTGRSARDPHGRRYLELPETYAGQVMVFKVQDRVSFALVMSATRAVHALDKVVNPGTKLALQ